jgi:small-conductance mechanosensitive channel
MAESASIAGSAVAESAGAAPAAATVDGTFLPVWLREIFSQHLDWFIAGRMGLLLLALLVVVVVSGWVKIWAKKRWNAQIGMLVGRGVRYLGVILIGLSILRELGFEIGPVLGAMGVLGVALGFASQTSLSNVIAGLFLLSDRALAVGDLVRIDGQVGTVQSIDLLAVRIRTPNNQLIRVPNETLIKANLVTLNKFPIRRVDIPIGVAYKEDVERVRQVLCEVIDANSHSLAEPEPLILFDSYGSSSLDFVIGVWCLREDWLATKNSLMDAIKDRFDTEGIEIPFPHLSIYAGSTTDPMPVQVNDPVQPS